MISPCGTFDVGPNLSSFLLQLIALVGLALGIYRGQTYLNGRKELKTPQDGA